MKMRPIRFILALLLTALLALPALAAGEQLVVNGDFSQGSGSGAEGWNTSAWISDELSTLFSFEEDGELGRVAVIENLVENDARFEQVIAVEPDTVYELSGRMRVEGATGSIGANLSVADTFVYTDMLNETYGEWVEVSAYIRTGREQTQLTLYARLGGYGGTTVGKAAFADISLVRAEPGVGSYIQDLETPTQQGTTQQDAASGLGLGPMVALLVVIAALAAAIAALTRRYWTLLPSAPQQPRWAIVALVFTAALVIRVIMAVCVHGYPNDIDCWKGWSQLAFEEGFAGFYTSGAFADYPPSYIYVLYIVGAIRSLLSLEHGSPLFLLLVKLPSILADLGAGWLIFSMARRRFGWGASLGFAAVYLFTPAILINASAWGQVDAILALCMVGCLWLSMKGRWVETAALFAVSFLFKPQMLFIAPAFLPGIVFYIRENSLRRVLLTLGKSLAALAGCTLAIILPFTGGRSLSWIAELLAGTVGSYPYGSVNAANLACFSGGLWTDQGQLILGLPYSVWGVLGILAACGLTLYCIFRDRERQNLLFYGALLVTGIFTLAHGMHERYMFPALLLLAVSYAMTGRRLHMWCFAAFSVPQFINMALVLVNMHLPVGSVFVSLLSLTQCILFGLMAAAAVMQARGIPVEERLAALRLRRSMAAARRPALGWLGESRPAPVPRSWDRWAIWVLTAVYAAVALVNLGDMQVPQTLWTVSRAGQSFVVDLGEEAPAVTELWQYRTLSASGASILVEESDDRVDWTPAGQITLDDNAYDVFRWFRDPVSADSRYLRITFTQPYLRELELALVGSDGRPIPVKQILEVQADDPDGPQRLFDEQDLVPASPTYLNGTYFDEIYHARTAWEHLEGMEPYEISHPPLGKVLIMLGMSLFGVTPFGWRIAGAVFGVLMIPMIYGLARLLLRSGKLALVAAFMLSWDFMHFTQTRIATIDGFAVFFILCMYFFMARYFTVSHPEASRGRQRLWLALSGISFGLGAATKWICIYAGAGLAVLFFIDVGLGLRRYLRARREPQPPAWVGGYVRALVQRLLWCVLFFVIVPVAIYVASYAPYMLEGHFDLGLVWRNQVYMLSYHGGLVDDHFFASPWYEWPLIHKPMWYYQDTSLPAGTMSSIAALGNPAVWWVGIAAMVLLAVRVIRERGSRWQSWFILIGFLAQYLPWVLVPRSTFIYHYFASVPFIILAAVMLMGDAAARRPWVRRAIPVYLAAVLLLFILFYPVLSGAPIPSAYGDWLTWMPSWYFTY